MLPGKMFQGTTAHLWFSMVSCAFCEFLRKSAPSRCFAFWEEECICKNERKSSNFCELDLVSSTFRFWQLVRASILPLGPGYSIWKVLMGWNFYCALVCVTVRCCLPSAERHCTVMQMLCNFLCLTFPRAKLRRLIFMTGRNSGRRIGRKFGRNFLGIFVLRVLCRTTHQNLSPNSSQFVTPCLVTAPVTESQNFISASFWGLGRPKLWSSLNKTMGVAFFWQYSVRLSCANGNQAVTDPCVPPTPCPPVRSIPSTSATLKESE